MQGCIHGKLPQQRQPRNQSRPACKPKLHATGPAHLKSCAVAGRAPVQHRMWRHTGTLNTLLAQMLYTRSFGQMRSIKLMHSSSDTGNTPCGKPARQSPAQGDLVNGSGWTGTMRVPLRTRMQSHQLLQAPSCSAKQRGRAICMHVSAGCHALCPSTNLPGAFLACATVSESSSSCGHVV